MYADKRNFNCNSIIWLELVTSITNTYHNMSSNKIRNFSGENINGITSIYLFTSSLQTSKFKKARSHFYKTNCRIKLDFFNSEE
jgi:hypothetical protein